MSYKVIHRNADGLETEAGFRTLPQARQAAVERLSKHRGSVEIVNTSGEAVALGEIVGGEIYWEES